MKNLPLFVGPMSKVMFELGECFYQIDDWAYRRLVAQRLAAEPDFRHAVMDLYRLMLTDQMMFGIGSELIGYATGYWYIDDVQQDDQAWTGQQLREATEAVYGMDMATFRAALGTYAMDNNKRLLALKEAGSRKPARELQPFPAEI